MPRQLMFATLRLSSFRPRIPSALSRALGLFLVSSLVRGLGAVAALALAAYIGTGVDMDHYMAYGMVVAAACALLASPLPVIVTKRLVQGPDLATTAQVCRQWAKKIQGVGFLCYAIACPLLAWLFTPKNAPGFSSLLVLLLLGLPAAIACAPLATEQALLQARGHPFQAMWSSALSSGGALVAASLCGLFGGIYLAALGVSLGCCLELLWLRRLNRVIDKPVVVVPAEAFPWATMLTVLGASSGILLQSFYDQSLLAHMGPGAQASWGLATRIPSFLNMSLAGMAGVLCSATLTQAKTAGQLHEESFRLCKLVMILSLSIMGVIWLSAEPVIRTLYERGAFTAEDTHRVAGVLRWTIISYLTYPATCVVIRALGLIGGYRVMVLSSVLYLAIKVVLTSALFSRMGIGAMTLGTFAAGISQLVLLGWCFCVAKLKPTP